MKNIIFIICICLIACGEEKQVSKTKDFSFEEKIIDFNLLYPEHDFGFPNSYILRQDHA
jgi:hypothetical protein